MKKYITLKSGWRLFVDNIVCYKAISEPKNKSRIELNNGSSFRVEETPEELDQLIALATGQTGLFVPFADKSELDKWTAFKETPLVFAVATLKEHGYHTESIWHVDDVRSKFRCTEEEAYGVLDDVLSNDWINEKINEKIWEEGQEQDLPELVTFLIPWNDTELEWAPMEDDDWNDFDFHEITMNYVAETAEIVVYELINGNRGKFLHRFDLNQLKRK